MPHNEFDVNLPHWKTVDGQHSFELTLKTDTPAQSGTVLFNLESTWKQFNVFGLALDTVDSVRFPVKRKLITVNKAPFINVVSKEQFHKSTHRMTIHVFADVDNGSIKQTSIHPFKPDSFVTGMKHASMTDATRGNWKLGWNESV